MPFAQMPQHFTIAMAKQIENPLFLGPLLRTFAPFIGQSIALNAKCILCEDCPDRPNAGESRRNLLLLPKKQPSDDRTSSTEWIASSLLSVRLDQVHRHLASLRARVVAMNDRPRSVAFIDLGSTTIGQWTLNASHPMGPIRPHTSKQTLKQSKSAGVPRYCEHHCVRLDGVMLPFRASPSGCSQISS